MRWRTLWAVAAAITCTANPWMASTANAGPAAPQEPRTIRVVTYNIHFGTGLDGQYDLHRVCEDIRLLHPDIVGLQEVDVRWDARSRFDDQLRTLAHELQMNAYMAPVYQYATARPDTPRQSGNAILSRFPILEMNNRYLTRVAPSPTHAHTPQHNGGRPNALISTPGFLDVKVEVGRSPLHVYVTHLDSREDPAVRRRQVQEMVRVMERETGAQMLLGDLNASPSAEELKPLWNLFQDAASSERAENTYPADHPTRRIDYVLVSPDIQIRSSSTLPTVASDHRPVTAEVTLPRLN